MFWYRWCCHCELLIEFFGVWTSLTRWILYDYSCLWVTVEIDYWYSIIPFRNCLYYAIRKLLMSNCHAFRFLSFLHGKFCGHRFRKCLYCCFLLVILVRFFCIADELLVSPLLLFLCLTLRLVLSSLPSRSCHSVFAVCCCEGGALTLVLLIFVWDWFEFRSC